MTVYFLRRTGDEDGLIKIGFTADMDTRLINLRVATPEGLDVLCAVIGGRDLESYLHAAFDQDRVSGEWFKPSKDLTRIMDILRRQGVGALPAGALGVYDDPEQDADLSNLGDIIVATRLLRRCALPVAPGESVKSQILKVSRRLRWSFSRCKDIWYGDSRISITAWEMRKLYAVHNEAWLDTPEQKEIASLKARVAALEGSLK